VHAIGHSTGEAWTYTNGVISQYRLGYEWKKQKAPHLRYGSIGLDLSRIRDVRRAKEAACVPMMLPALGLFSMITVTAASVREGGRRRSLRRPDAGALLDASGGPSERIAHLSTAGDRCAPGFQSNGCRRWGTFARSDTLATLPACPFCPDHVRNSALRAQRPATDSK
jgi:hypothetical protein